jgi:hypothetical protein
MTPKSESANLGPEFEVSRYMPGKGELESVEEHENRVHKKNCYIYATCVVHTHYLNRSIQMYKLHFPNSMK